LDGERFTIGELDGVALHTPGHTPDSMTYVVGDAAFIGDTLFMPDYGTARADFPGGDARALYRSAGRVLSLPGATRLFLCHDYKRRGAANSGGKPRLQPNARTTCICTMG
jgi:glyoxylase-like metal-dependent hydrolase (beta-lactamase superfamily II)